jgi:hypothetical protein
MIALLTISPTLIALLLMWSSIKLGWPIDINFERHGMLFINAQIFFIAIAAAAILIAKKSEQDMPKWRIEANKWIGRIMAAFCLFYLVAFVLYST